MKKSDVTEEKELQKHTRLNFLLLDLLNLQYMLEIFNFSSKHITAIDERITHLYYFIFCNMAEGNIHFRTSSTLYVPVSVNIPKLVYTCFDNDTQFKT